ncbi:MAG: S8 family serine peptidase [Acidobacteriota bacterium]
MKRLLSLFAVTLLSSTLFAADAPTKSWLVATRGPAGKLVPRMLDVMPEAVVSRIANFKSVDGFAAELTEEQVSTLKKASWVRFIEPDYERHALGIAPQEVRNHVGQTLTYGVSLVRADQVWTKGRGAAIKVGVIDSGMDLNQPDLKDHLRGGFDFVQNDDTPQDEAGHGTHVTGIIGALDNNIGVVGVAPDVDLYILRVLDAKGSGKTSNVIRAVDWAIEHKLNVLNLSLGSADPSDLEQAAFQRASDAGILAFAASGNAYEDNLKVDGLDYPGGYPNVISVGAIDSGDVVANFSQRGNGLSVVAPGVNVLSTFRVGLGEISDVTFSNNSFDEAVKLTYSPQTSASGDYVFCGLGGTPTDFPAAVRGKIALIARGDFNFSTKARNAKAAGATGVIIYNNIAADTSGGGAFGGVLCEDFNTTTHVCTSEAAELAFGYPVTIGISKEDGEAMVASLKGPVTVSARPDDYAILSGTSMSTPHAAGVAALIWSLSPNSTAQQVKDALFTTAVDLGAPGYDTVFGNGQVDALAAAKKLAPQLFPTGPPPRVRSRRGGH